ncbi:MAG: M15 family metallopeptidase [Clostridiaceae bacterium]|jgi:hypothetical protein|nr:M15 family metallopeptidase [Clostridiaceae bacterium]
MSGLAISAVFQHPDSQYIYNDTLFSKNSKINCIFTKLNIEPFKPNYTLVDNSDEDIYNELKKHPNLTIPNHVNAQNMKNSAKKALLAAVKWADNNGYKVTLTSGYREYGKQKRLFKREPNIADAPNHSMHCKGLAFDIALYKKGSKSKIRNPKLYLQLAESLKKEKFDIYNGRDFPDAPKDSQWKEAWHFQIGANDGFLFSKSTKNKVVNK